MLSEKKALKLTHEALYLLKNYVKPTIKSTLFMIGLVMKSTGLWYKIKSEEGNVISARLRRRVELDNTLKSTNPVAVGDLVLYELEDEENALIYEIKDRRNYLIRKATNLSRQVHIVAANLDQIVLITSIKNPRVPLRFVDRLIVAAESFHIPVTIILNKKDLLTSEKEEEKRKQFQEQYSSIGYSVKIICAEDPNDIKLIKSIFKNKTSVLTGFSGVGKSTLINAIYPGLTLKTDKISGSSKKGKHTTTFAEMFEPEKGDLIIDTPGIKSLGLIGIENWELSHLFPEMKKVLSKCKFSTCLHVNEPSCAVLKALENGQIGLARYESYLFMLEEDQKFR